MFAQYLSRVCPQTEEIAHGEAADAKASANRTLFGGVFNAPKPHRTIRTPSDAPKPAPRLTFAASRPLAQVRQLARNPMERKECFAGIAPAPRLSFHLQPSSSSSTALTCRMVLDGNPDGAAPGHRDRGEGRTTAPR